MVTGADLLVAAIENEGGTWISGIGGEETLDLLDSVRRSKIKFDATRHEHGAGIMAANHGRLTGRPGVCLATVGPGALNLQNAANYARLIKVPMVMIVGQKKIKSDPQAGFQKVDVINAMKSYTKMAEQIVSPASIPTMVRKAFQIAMQEPPGPVILELPMDIAEEKIQSVPLIPVHPIEFPVASGVALDRAAKMILAAERPLIMLGAAASRPPSGITNFVQRTGIPFFTTQMGKGVVSEYSNQYIGTAALSQDDYVHDAIDKADLIITIGHITTEKPPFIMRAEGAKVIHISYSPAPVEEVYFPNAEVVGDLGPSLDLLADRLEGRLPNAGALLTLREGIMSAISDRADEERWPVTPQRLVHAVREVMPENGIVALDNGAFKIWFARNYRTYAPNTLLLDNGLATMGAGLATGMMAAKLHPERRVMVVGGDGGFMMDNADLETAVRLKLNLLVLILKDGGYGMISWKQAADQYPDYGQKFGNIDFVKLAEALGAKGTRVEALDDLVPAMEAAFEGGGVHLIEIPIDYSENLRVLTDELRLRKAARAVATRYKSI
ncbi:acetolactate synthase large subunit [Neorhizobium galegae]|uniref:acetolactate synthase large subunit n=1 Tax=Neorhizobium galegae TaxID=399 RepID=UPI001277204F|nr:acetolactate synthase large subunit [Neorhizobium galegae]KAA9382527.1 acetolactate synthase large subunit [Neorhizobium galegae]KAA9382541.1 acetolactate synthase large subunit [Neorhizobium galegae]KAB1109686.1 acetolactate synthase large subunit [Neorhizobium galegae]MCM2501634.1 acetolactate synthase large subunit [Neorhizobium galegae]MCQ1772920.1 acetolactate synthase large subunit [Neorhizobium galegae]